MCTATNMLRSEHQLGVSLHAIQNVVAPVQLEAAVAIFILRFVLFMKIEGRFCDRNKSVWEELGVRGARK